MVLQQKDFILRLIEELGATLREIRNSLMRGGAAAAPSVVEQAVAAQGRLLGPLGPALSAVDAETAASLLPETKQLRLWAELIELEAEGRKLAGEDDAAKRLAHRSAALLAVADRRETGMPSP